MNRLTAGILLCFFVAFPVSAQLQPAAETSPVSKSSAPTVTLMMAATDKTGQPIGGLNADQVMVFDNGQPAKTLEVLSATDLPLHLGIVLISSKSNFAQQQAAASELVQKLIRPGKDKAFVVTAGGSKAWPYPRLDWQADPQALVGFINGLDRGAGLADRFEFDLSNYSAGDTRMAVQKYSLAKFTVFDAIWAMMATDRTPARRAVVIFRNPVAHSPGWDQEWANRVDNHHLEIIANAQILGIGFYAIAVQEPTPVPRNLSQSYAPQYTGSGGTLRTYDERMGIELDRLLSAGKANVERMALETGGRVWWKAKKNYTDVTAAIIGELNSQYAVMFEPNLRTTVSGPARPLRVTLKHKEALVSAPRAYFPPRPAATQGEGK